MQIAFGSCFLQSRFLNIKTFIIFFSKKRNKHSKILFLVYKTVFKFTAKYVRVKDRTQGTSFVSHAVSLEHLVLT